MRRLSVALAATGWVAVLGAGPAAKPAPADATAGAGHHRAAVIVDTGAQVKTVCVRFAEESITGVEALKRAGVDPVFRAFPGKGAAVCSLCGTGCSGDESCLTCDPEGRFWSYSRAAAGSSDLRVSGAGASSTTVRDGDVEGWRWGSGGTPVLVTVEQVCGEAAATSTSTSSSTPAVAQPGEAPAQVTGPPASATGTTAPGSRPSATGSMTTAPTVGRTGTTVPAGPSPTNRDTAVETTPAPLGGPAPTSAPTSAAPSGLAAATTRETESGTGWGGLIAAGSALLALLAWAKVARRRRRDGP